MVICPCSMGTVSAIAQGSSRSLVERAADVALKERRKLIVVPRETPLSLVHLRNLTALTEAGGVVIPAAPGFYHRPTKISELVDFIVQRVLDQLGLDIDIAPRWGGQGLRHAAWSIYLGSPTDCSARRCSRSFARWTTSSTPATSARSTS